MRPFVLILTAALAAHAQAQSGASWMGYANSGRNLAEGGGLGVMASGADGMGLNPAALDALPGGGQVQASYAQWPGEIGVQYGQAALRTGFGVLGVQGSWVDFGNIDAYGVDAYNGVQATGGSMHPHASDLGLGLGGHLGRVSLGAEAHMLSEDLVGQGTSSAAAIDAGLRMEVLRSMTASVSLLNAGQSLDGSALPTAVRGGLALSSPSGDGWELGVEASSPTDGGQSDLLGAVRYQVAAPVILRAGWMQGAGQDGTWSAGVSFQLGMVGVDYGFRQVQNFNPVNQFTLRLQW